MLAFLTRRLATILPTLLFVTILIFGLQQLLPGDAAKVLAGEDQDPTVVEYLRKKMHLDEPFPVRYAYWLGGVLRGDLGESLRMQKPVTALIAEKLPVTIELAALAIVIAPANSAPDPMPWKIRRTMRRIGAQTPMVSAVGSSPMNVVATPMKSSVMRSVGLRPSLSP